MKRKINSKSVQDYLTHSVNNLEDFSLVTFVILNPTIINEILKGSITNMLWFTIKSIVLYIREKIKGEKYYTIQAGKVDEKEIKFGVKVNLDENTSFNFEINGNLDKEIIEHSLDKVLAFLKEQKPKKSHELPDYVQYSVSKKKWISVNVVDELLKNKGGK